MLTREDLHDYQLTAIEHVKDKKKCGLFLDMGLGKTATALTAANDFLESEFVNKVLVIAPLRVANTVWRQEAEKWEHLSLLKVSVCCGTAKQRVKALETEADIYVINPEAVVWLVDNYFFKWKWDMLIVDESSKFKSHKALRFKALKRVVSRLKSVVLLTGTPSSNGMHDLWSQIYLLDLGDRLGINITKFRDDYFKENSYMLYTYTIRKGSAAIIQDKIKDICISMSADDLLDLPDRISLRTEITLPPAAKQLYSKFRKDFLLEIDEVEISASSSAVLAGKLLQLCNGCVYDENRTVHNLHNEKIDALKDIIDENQNENFLVAYNFQTDLTRITKAFPKAVVLSKDGRELDDWNAGKIKMLLAHPASAGHGINAQFGGSAIIWFGLTWSLENYQQFNARVHRQGQTKTVRIMHIVAKDCIDEKVLRALSSKAKNQNELLAFLKSELMAEQAIENARGR